MKTGRYIPIMALMFSALIWLLSAQAFGEDRRVEDDELFDVFTGYRQLHYRSPVTLSPPGIETIDVKDTVALLQAGAIALDVHPLQFQHITESGHWITAEDHASLPGAVWLPVVGWANMEGWAEDYLRDSLEAIAHDDQTVIVFCQHDCWLSWNAVQRVADLGYDARWFPGGVDAWREAGLSLDPIEPWPL